jgi:hypothetical protein
MLQEAAAKLDQFHAATRADCAIDRNSIIVGAVAEQELQA